MKPSSYVNPESGHKIERKERVNGKNERAMFAHELKNTKWDNLYREELCLKKFEIFEKVINKLVESHFPIKSVKSHSKDKPWVTCEFKDLIIQRQITKTRVNTIQYNRLQNRINRFSKTLRQKFYNQKVLNLKNSDPKTWWRNTKELAGISKSDASNVFKSLANSETNGNTMQLCNKVNDFFHSVSAPLPPINTEEYRYEGTIPDEYLVSVTEIEKALFKIKLGKAPGPDNIKPWMLRDLAPYFAGPVTSIFNASIRQGTVPDIWKSATICPIPKKSQPKHIETDLRPISLTCLLAKELEKIVIRNLRKAIEGKTGKKQFGNTRGVSTTHMLVEMLHIWHEAVDTGKMVRIILLDYSKAFDMINHSKLQQKMRNLDVPPTLIKWFAHFLSKRTIRTRIGDHISTPRALNGAIPQGAVFGMEGFCIYIDDLVPELPLYKYVDDSTTYSVMDKNSPNDDSLQVTINQISEWSEQNDMKMNPTKTHELLLHFGKAKPELVPITINDIEINRVTSTKLVGVTIQENLKWDSHIAEITKKASSKLFFLGQLRKAKIPEKDLLTFYCSIIRPNLEYAVPVWGTGLSNALSKSIESIQRRALRIIKSELSYADCLHYFKLKRLDTRRMDICRNIFKSVRSNKNVINHLLPEARVNKYRLRKLNEYPKIKTRTKRFKNTFIPFCLDNYQ